MAKVAFRIVQFHFQALGIYLVPLLAKGVAQSKPSSRTHFVIGLDGVEEMTIGSIKQKRHVVECHTFGYVDSKSATSILPTPSTKKIVAELLWHLEGRFILARNPVSWREQGTP